MPRAAIQDKYWACVGLFDDWVRRSDGTPLVEWVVTGAERELQAILDVSGTARVPSPEMIIDFLMQARAARGHTGRAGKHVSACGRASLWRRPRARMRATLSKAAWV